MTDERRKTVEKLLTALAEAFNYCSDRTGGNVKFFLSDDQTVTARFTSVNGKHTDEKLISIACDSNLAIIYDVTAVTYGWLV